MKPTVGRIVHYVSRGSADGRYPSVHVPFLLVQCHSPQTVSGWTFNDSGTRYERSVPFDADGGPATWHWPERED